MGWSVQERYRGGLNWIFEEVGLSVGGTFSGSESTCVDKGWSGCEKEMQRYRTPFSESLGLTSLGLQGVLLRNSAN